MENIKIEDFLKIEIKVGKVQSCEKIEWSNKLLKLQVDFENETRTIFSGIAKYYQPEDLIGNNYLFVTNLEKRKMGEEFSEGMILAIEDRNGVVSLITPDKEVSSGAVVR
jgi:methionyl-tRNA synthetase